MRYMVVVGQFTQPESIYLGKQLIAVHYLSYYIMLTSTDFKMY